MTKYMSLFLCLVLHKVGLCRIFPYIPKDLTVLGFIHTSTLVGHFVSSPRDREKRDRRDSTGDERDGTGEKRK